MLTNPHPAVPYQFVHQLAKLPHVATILLFGSRARGDHRPRSDIDLAITMTANSNDRDWFDILDVIEEADTLLEIDCVNLAKAEDKFKQRILDEGVILYDQSA